MSIVIVAAVADNGVIGRAGDLPWHLPEDLARFKRLTMGGTLVMGRKTFESIGRALPGRTTVVVTRQHDWPVPEGVVVSGSIEEALGVAAARDDTAFVVGGSAIFAGAFGLADRLEITEVHDEPDGDVWFPAVDWSDWTETTREDHPGYSFVTYERA